MDFENVEIFEKIDNKLKPINKSEIVKLIGRNQFYNHINRATFYTVSNCSYKDRKFIFKIK